MTLEQQIEELLLGEYGPHFRTREVAKRLVELFEKVKPKGKVKA